MTTNISIEIGRHAIDSQGVASDEEVAAAEAFVLDALRTEWPDAEITAVGRGGRTAGVDGENNITHDVKRVASRALNDFWTQA